MVRITNMADPDYEPSDEDLRELSREAFADIGAQHEARLARLRQEIESLANAQPRANGWRSGAAKTVR